MLSAAIEEPISVAVDPTDGGFILCEYRCVRRAFNGVLATIAGSPSVGGFIDGVGFSARFNNLQSVAITSKGVIYCSDYRNHRIRSVKRTNDGSAQSWIVTTVGGSGREENSDGAALNAGFKCANGIAIDPTNESVLFVCCFGGRIARLDVSAGIVLSLRSMTSLTFRVICVLTGVVSTLKTSASLIDSSGFLLTLNGTHLIVSKLDRHAIHAIDLKSGETMKLAGGGQAGCVDGSGAAARFDYPTEICLDESDRSLIVTDSGNDRIRRIIGLPNEWFVR